MNPAWPRGYQRKGSALFYLERVDEAINTYKEGLKVDPSNADLQKDLKAAESKAAEGANPQFNQAYLNALLKLMQHPETKDLFQDPSFMGKLQAIMQNPQLAAVYMQQDPRLQKVLEVLQQETSPEDIENLTKQFQNKFDAGKPKAQPQPQQPKKEEHSAPPPPKKEEPKPEKMDVEDPAEERKNKGNEEFKKKNFNDALNLYEEAVKLNPNEPLYYNNKAATYIELKDYELALQEIARAEQLFEEGVAKDYVKKAKVLARKGTVLAKLERYGEAVEALEKSLIEDNIQKVRDELLKVKKLRKEKEAKEYVNPELAEKHNEQAAALYKEGTHFVTQASSRRPSRSTRRPSGGTRRWPSTTATSGRSTSSSWSSSAPRRTTRPPSGRTPTSPRPTTRRATATSSSRSTTRPSRATRPDSRETPTTTSARRASRRRSRPSTSTTARRTRKSAPNAPWLTQKSRPSCRPPRCATPWPSSSATPSRCSTSCRTRASRPSWRS